MYENLRILLLIGTIVRIIIMNTLSKKEEGCLTKYLQLEQAISQEDEQLLEKLMLAKSIFVSKQEFNRFFNLFLNLRVGKVDS